MRQLYVLNSRCSQSFKFLYPAFMKNRLNAMNFPETFLRTYPVSISSSRHFSWEGIYSSIALSTPVLTIQDLMFSYHSYSGLPWWAVIGLSTLAIRSMLVFPLAVHQTQVVARITNLNEELSKMVPEMNKEVNAAAKLLGWNENTARKVFRKNMRSYYNKFIIRDNCHPFKIVLLTFFQVPAWICFSFALRNITMYSLQNPSLGMQLKTEGILWFMDLTQPDMFFIPILLTAVNLLIIEINTLKQIGKGTKFQKILKHVMQALTLIIGGAATLNSTSVTFYWLCSSVFGAAQNLLFLSPRFRQIFRIPTTANDSNTPYKDIASNFKKRFSL